MVFKIIFLLIISLSIVLWSFYEKIDFVDSKTILIYFNFELSKEPPEIEIKDKEWNKLLISKLEIVNPLTWHNIVKIELVEDLKAWYEYYIVPINIKDFDGNKYDYTNVDQKDYKIYTPSDLKIENKNDVEEFYKESLKTVDRTMVWEVDPKVEEYVKNNPINENELVNLSEDVKKYHNSSNKNEELKTEAWQNLEKAVPKTWIYFYIFLFSILIVLAIYIFILKRWEK